MAGTWKWYGNALLSLVNGDLAFDTDTFKLALYTNSLTPNQDTDTTYSATNEVGASGTYSAGGATLSLTGAPSYDTGTNEVRIAWNSPSFTSATITARHAIIYRSAGSPANRLIAYCTEASDVSSTAGTFSVTLPSPTLKITAS